jgi:hypothetical protein
MARNRKLKVFRVPIGFHDAYVAAPSQKAALEAWGSDADLFARGIAERVTDEALTREPLDNPGKVVKRLRGSAEEQLAALPPDRPKPKRRPADGAAKKTAKSRSRPPAARKATPKPRPLRANLDRAEKRLDDLLAEQKEEEAALRARERERRDLDRDHAKAQLRPRTSSERNGSRTRPRSRSGARDRSLAH